MAYIAHADFLNADTSVTTPLGLPVAFVPQRPENALTPLKRNIMLTALAFNCSAWTALILAARHII